MDTGILRDYNHVAWNITVVWEFPDSQVLRAIIVHVTSRTPWGLTNNGPSRNSAEENI